MPNDHPGQTFVFMYLCTYFDSDYGAQAKNKTKRARDRSTLDTASHREPTSGESLCPNSQKPYRIDCTGSGPYALPNGDSCVQMSYF